MKMDLRARIDPDSTRAWEFTHTDELVQITKFAKQCDDKLSVACEVKLPEHEARLLLRYLSFLFPEEVS